MTQLTFTEHYSTTALGHVMNYKTSLNKCKTLKIIQSMFSNKNGI